MYSLTQRWYLLGTATNPHGVTHFTVTCRDATDPEDYKVLLRVLKNVFGAVEDGRLAGPYSVHQFMRHGNFRFGIVLDAPDELDLYTTDMHDVGTMASLVARILHTLNDQNADQSEPSSSEPDTAPNPANL